MQIMLCDQPDRDASQGSQTIQFNSLFHTI